MPPPKGSLRSALESIVKLCPYGLAGLLWSEIEPHAIKRLAEKSSRKRRNYVTIPRVPELDNVLRGLREMKGKTGFDTGPVTHKGDACHKDTLSREVGKLVREAGIVHHEPTRAGSGQRAIEKHLNDARGTFATHLMTTTNLSNTELAEIMGWTVEQVVRIRRIYVDDTARTVALARRIAARNVDR